MKTLSITLATALLLLDQLLKYFAAARGPSTELYTYTLNTGVTFGFFPQANTAMIVISVAAIILLGYVLYTTQKTEFFGVSIIMAGVLSNAIDRAVRGGVVDYISVGAFPVFNLADALIISGVALLIGLEIQKSTQNSSSSSKSSR